MIDTGTTHASRADGTDRAIAGRPAGNFRHPGRARSRRLFDRRHRRPNGSEYPARSTPIVEPRRRAVTLPDPILEYRITAEDEAGPFVSEIPSDLVVSRNTPALDYRSVVEALAERFHTTPEVLHELNASASFTAGNSVRVPNVEPLVVRDARAARTSEGRFEWRGTSRRHERSPTRGRQGAEERQAGP